MPGSDHECIAFQVILSTTVNNDVPLSIVIILLLANLEKDWPQWYVSLSIFLICAHNDSNNLRR